MSSIRRLAAACGAVTALLVVTACGPSDDSAASDPTPSASAGKADGKDGFKLPEGLPTSLQQLKNWKWDDWKNWADQHAQSAFKNPLVKDLWDASRMAKAKPLDQEVKAAPQDDQGVTDPEPSPVEAKRVPTPYHDHAAPPGKIFFDSPRGSMVCSGTLVKDPAHPGKSNLVWTAGHCVHGGKDGGWYRNIQFVPAYNDNGKDLNKGESATQQDVAPYGEYWAEWAQTSSQWIEGGGHTGGPAAAYDFAILKVTPLRGGKSLEETVGNALPVWFNAPRGALQKGVSAYGYPAAPPFDGQLMHQCTDSATRLSMDASAPTMLRIGCTMTGGSSGGGWYTRGTDGKPALVSNTSIGPVTNTWLAGPYLGSTARSVFKALSDKFANQ
ncbi:trypsin-like serine peptidase [Wenjunlia tyrosinilytica]|uniref:Secreted protein n=1 Tax=Wenjunlia tyrosinilytica TaxID=1544741 RepID=A0A917ZTY8_9ACTN|nr:hypothetical protein [Wenjunlia tyrosinilytica]GGO91469.1 hypothetical protein GCM10012280_39420 [Wenjunlia tyrosinilytica]